MSDVLKEIARIGMIPVLSIDQSSRALPLARALSAGGLPLMEVMFRTEAAAECIALIARHMPDFLVGAGTVLSVEQAQQAVDCGARFLVAPGFNPELVRWARQRDIPIVPGCVSPSEVDAARLLGLKVLKFFPAVENGGVRAMELLSGPFPEISFVPTGDLTLPLAVDYLSCRKVAAAGGDFMLSYADIYADHYPQITASVRQALATYFNFHLKYIAVQAADALPAAQQAAVLLQDFNIATPADEALLRQLPPDTAPAAGRGLIAVGTRDAERAYYYLRRCGLDFAADSLCRSADGRLLSARLKLNFHDFALQLMQD